MKKIATFNFGISDRAPNSSSTISLGPNTYNFIPTEEGYIANYPGRTDIFFRVKKGENYDAFVGTPPPIGIITRIFFFIDSYGNDHLVFVKGADICEKFGNSFRILKSLTGSSYDGLYFPYMFTHQSKLVILNFGDVPYIWDGITSITPLGVHEIPVAPDVRAEVAPGCVTEWHNGVFAWANLWWPQEIPRSGPSQNQDANGDPINGLLQWRLQFFDQYGNKSRAGAVSPVLIVPQQYTKTATLPGAGTLVDYIVKTYVVIDWTPPMVDSHVVGYILGRTLNLNDDDPQGGYGSYNLFYEELVVTGTTLTRHTSQLTDTLLLEQPLMDLEVGPPPTGSIGCSWNGRIFISGTQESNVVFWSDAGYFGNFRDSFSAKSKVVSISPIGDRIVIITTTSTETLYEGDNGLQILEQNFSIGSSYGASFVDVGGAIFGLWERGFAFYDGKEHRFVDAPYWLEGIYNDPSYRLSNAYLWKDFYHVLFRQGYTANENNIMVVFNIKTGQWYVIKDSFYDLTSHGDHIYGCDDSIYEIYKGRYPVSRLELVNVLPDGSSPFSERRLEEIRFIMRPSSNSSLDDIEITSMFSSVDGAPSKSEPLMPTLSSNERAVFRDPHWGKVGLNYNPPNAWTRKNDFIFTPTFTSLPTGITHDFMFTFPYEHPIFLKFVQFIFSEDMDGEY